MNSINERIMDLVNQLDARQRSAIVKDIWALNKSEKPILTDEQKAENKRAAIAKSLATRAAKRAQAIADGSFTPKSPPTPLSHEEKTQRKIVRQNARLLGLRNAPQTFPPSHPLALAAALNFLPLRAILD